MFCMGSFCLGMALLSALANLGSLVDLTCLATLADPGLPGSTGELLFLKPEPWRFKSK